MQRGIRNLIGGAALCALLSPPAAQAMDRGVADATAQAVGRGAGHATAQAVGRGAGHATAQAVGRDGGRAVAVAVDLSAGHAPAQAVDHGAGHPSAPADGGPGSAPVHRPVAVAPVPGEVVRAFEQPDGAYGPGHRGVDLAVTAREPVRSAMNGTVRFAGPVAGETWVTVTHADGVETTYGGIAPSVTPGQQVEIGERLGTMRPGMRVLDWGARIGRTYIDPLGLLAGWRVRLVAPSHARRGPPS